MQMASLRIKTCVYESKSLLISVLRLAWYDVGVGWRSCIVVGCISVWVWCSVCVVKKFSWKAQGSSVN